MPFLKPLREINWKYIVGEILLLFVGINLAIWFNDWNSSSKAKQDKAFAIEKIKDEINSNLKELTTAHSQNKKVVDAYQEFKGYWYQKNSSHLLATPQELRTLQQNYPRFFTVKDSTSMPNGKFHYRGQTYIFLELAELSEIAWTTAKNTQVTKQIAYPCLYELESMYNLQRRIQREIDKAAEALQLEDIMRLMRILSFIDQLSDSLQEDYQQIVSSIDNC